MMKNLANKFALHSLNIIEGILFCTGFTGSIYGITRNALQSAAIKKDRYSIDQEFQVVTSAIIICSVVVLITAGILGIISRVASKSMEKTEEYVESITKKSPIGNSGAVSESFSGWYCPHCGTQNSEYSHTCVCGTRKP